MLWRNTLQYINNQLPETPWKVRWTTTITTSRQESVGGLEFRSAAREVFYETLRKITPIRTTLWLLAAIRWLSWYACITTDALGEPQAISRPMESISWNCSSLSLLAQKKRVQLTDFTEEYWTSIEPSKVPFPLRLWYEMRRKLRWSGYLQICRSRCKY